MTDDEPTKNDKLRLVADNDPARIAERQKKIATDDTREQAAASLAALVANLLRVLAGGGQSYAVPSGLLKAVEHYRDAYNAGNRGEMPGLEDLSLHHLFREGEEYNKPQTEEGWRRWADDDPQRDYDEERRSLLHQLRRHVLREIASTIEGSDLQISREKREIDNTMRQLAEARERHFARPKRQPSTYRRSIAEHQIAKLRDPGTELQRAIKQDIPKILSQKFIQNSRQETADFEIKKLQTQKTDEMIAGLRRHQWLALYAVHSGTPSAFDATDAFAFNVLAKMRLLERKPGRGKTKRDWQLTDLGTLAMSRMPRTILDSSGQ